MVRVAILSIWNSSDYIEKTNSQEKCKEREREFKRIDLYSQMMNIIIRFNSFISFMKSTFFTFFKLIKPFLTVSGYPSIKYSVINIQHFTFNI